MFGISRVVDSIREIGRILAAWDERKRYQEDRELWEEKNNCVLLPVQGENGVFARISIHRYSKGEDECCYLSVDIMFRPSYRRKPVAVCERPGVLVRYTDLCAGTYQDFTTEQSGSIHIYLNGFFNKCDEAPYDYLRSTSRFEIIDWKLTPVAQTTNEN